MVKNTHTKYKAAVARNRDKRNGKKSQAAVYRRYINKMKEKTKKMNEKKGSSVPWVGYKKMIKEMSPEKRAFLMLRI